MCSEFCLPLLQVPMTPGHHQHASARRTDACKFSDEPVYCVVLCCVVVLCPCYSTCVDSARLPPRKGKTRICMYNKTRRTTSNRGAIDWRCRQDRGLLGLVGHVLSALHAPDEIERVRLERSVQRIGHLGEVISQDKRRLRHRPRSTKRNTTQHKATQRQQS